MGVSGEFELSRCEECSDYHMSIDPYYEVEPRLHRDLCIVVTKDLETVASVSSVALRALRRRIRVKPGNEPIESAEHDKRIEECRKRSPSPA